MTEELRTPLRLGAVVAFDRGSLTLFECLRSLGEQEGPPFDSILAVPVGEVAPRPEHLPAQILLLEGNFPTLGAALNAGLEKLEVDLCCLISQDCLVSTGFTRDLLALPPLNDDTVATCSISPHFADDLPSLLWFEDIFADQRLGTADLPRLSTELLLAEPRTLQRCGALDPLLSERSALATEFSLRARQRGLSLRRLSTVRVTWKRHLDRAALLAAHRSAGQAIALLALRSPSLFLLGGGWFSPPFLRFLGTSGLLLALLLLPWSLTPLGWALLAMSFVALSLLPQAARLARHLPGTTGQALRLLLTSTLHNALGRWLGFGTYSLGLAKARWKSAISGHPGT